MVTWIKNNKVLSALISLILIYFIWQFIQSFLGVNTFSLKTTSSPGSFAGMAPYAGSSESFGGIASPNIALPISGGYQNDYTPQTNVTNRLVVQESNLSLLVKDVVDARNKILDFTKTNGGYMVSASTSNPQDAPTAAITIRLPSDKLNVALDYFHSLSIKVVSENLLGHDVTDQYVDIDTRIKQLENTRSKFESILAQATAINDITNLTTQILNYQSQIDSLKGQQLSLQQNANFAKITVYLSTDEIALPYAPSETFRPAVIFKLAVRSLVGTLRDLASALIWVGVYAVIWVPIILVMCFIRKYLKNRKVQTVSKQ